MTGEIPQPRADNPDHAGWLPWLWILVASAAAHGCCLGARFYLDDFPQILDNTNLRDGQFLSKPLLAWTQFWLWLQYHATGCSAPAIHAVNWCLHAATAGALYLFARDFPGMKDKRGIALFAALVFAVHPLGSEIPNYARAQDIAWVTLFSLVAAWLAAKLATGGPRRLALWLALAVLGATCSKGPGLFHAMIACIVVVAALVPPARWQAARRHTGKLILAAAGILIILAALGWINLMARGMAAWSEPRFAGHALTLSRVFWEFAWRAILPIRLSADHHIAETLVPAGSAWWQTPDTIALAAAAGLGMFVLGTVLLVRRDATRLVGICLLIFALTMVFRVLYIVPEFMPEYRIYPGLPWFCLAAALVLDAVWRRWCKFSPLPLAFALLAGFAVLSTRRAMLWHDTTALMADVLHQYPTQSRAIWILQAMDARDGNWPQVIDRHKSALTPVDQALQAANRSLAPARELPTGHHALAMIGCICLNARAMAQVHGPLLGLRMLAGLETNLRQIQPPPQQVHWDLVTHARGLILEQAGDYQGAIRELTLEDGTSNARLMDLERVQAKLASQRAASGN